MRSHAKAASAATTGGTGITRSALSSLLLAALACVALAAFVSSATAATAGTSYGYKGEDIGTPDSGVFEEAGIANPVAVSNDDGRIFIIRQVSSELDILEPDGASIGRVDLSGSAPGGLPPQGVGVSADGSSLFVINYNSKFGPEIFGPPVLKLTSDSAPTPTYTVDDTWETSVPLESVSGIAVDQTTGNLIVGARGGIYSFDADSGALLLPIDGSTTDQGQFSGQGIAVAPNSDIYAIAGRGRVEHFGADGSWKGSLRLPLPDTSISPNGVAVNPQNSDVAVILPQGAESVIKVFTGANELKDTIRVPSAVATGVKGLAFSADGTKLYLALTDGSAHVLELGTRPGVDPPVASEVTTDGARLTAAVATGGESTVARIEYCPTSNPCEDYLGSEGESPWHVVTEETGLSDAQDSVETVASGLESNTEYLLRTTAVNEASQVEGISPIGSFKTALVPPAVQTGQAGSITDTSAELAGTIVTFGGQTTYHFEYGLTTGYGSTAPADAEGIAGNERSLRTFTETLKGLQPGTTYHYRLVATNAAGTGFGEDLTFTTLNTDEVAPKRGYEMVTPVEKKGLAIYANFGFQASADGSSIVYTANAPSAEASGAAQASRYMSHRGGNGWFGQQPLDPPINPIRAITFAVTQGVSADFEHTFVLSQKALTPDATEDAGNFYVNDLDTGAYHLIGTATQVGAFSQMAGPLNANQFIAGAPDFSWVVLISRYPLLQGAPKVAMYKWTRTSGLSLVSLLPGDVVPAGNTWFQSTGRSTNRLASDDGETFAFSLTSGEEGVYRRSSGETEAISVSQATGGPPGVQPGFADGMSRDGRYVFFHSPVQLTDEATDLGLKEYRYDASNGELEYLGPEDGTGDGTSDVLGIADDGSAIYYNSANQFVVWRDGQSDVITPQPLRGLAYGYPSPNGRYFSYLPGDGSVHLYDAETGEDTCMSCSANGVGKGGGLLGSQPDRNLSNRFPQVVTNDGHAYFETNSALMGADRNATTDVYEYYKGRLALISPGNAEFVASLADITPDGRSVYFTTSQGLVKQDTDRTYDLYVARVGGGFPEPPEPPSDCSGEACRGAAAAAPTATGIGSSIPGRSTRGKQTRPLHCRKGTHKVRRNGKARCVKNKSGDKNRDAKNNRGAGR